LEADASYAYTPPCFRCGIGELPRAERLKPTSVLLSPWLL